MTEFIDTNVFIRLLARDDPTKTERCLALFQRAEAGDVRLVTSETNVAEVVYVLASRVLYHLPRAEVARLLRPLVKLRALTIDHKESVLRAIDRYGSSNLDFEDCLAVAHMQRRGLTSIYSYDRGFDRVEGIQRLEP